MQVNKLQNYNTNFTSRVFITDYKDSDYSIQNFYKSKYFLNEAKKLEENGNQDTVVFSTDYRRIYITVKNDKDISHSYRIHNPYDDNDTFAKSIAKGYKLGCKDLKGYQWPHIPTELEKYIIS